jgi:hypothetical protein
MGNGFSKVNLDAEKKNNIDTISDFLEGVDTEICKQILSINSGDVVNLIEEQYCNRVIKIINHLLVSNFNNKEIFYMHKRIQDGSCIQDTDIYMNETITGETNLHYCHVISKHLVKIGHLYAVILSTLNPTFTYTDHGGVEKMGDLEDKDDAATNISLKETAICSKRISSLLLDINLLGINNCNADSMNDSLSIPELKPLYADIYNLEIKGYRKLSEESQKQYDNDLSTFYRSFTGRSKMPTNIKTFCDIKLNDHINRGIIQDRSFSITNSTGLQEIYAQSVNHNKNIIESQLFSNFAEHLANILKYAEIQKNDMLAIVNRLFYFKNDINIIHPRLSEEKLKSLVTQCRKLVVNIHITCEKDYVVSINMLEAIIELVRLKTQVRRIKRLEHALENFI